MMKKVQKLLGKLPAYVTYAGIDFNTQSLEQRLPASGYDEHLKTLFIWEGVVMYLSEAAVAGTLDFIVKHSAPGSRVAFDYIYTALLDGSVKHGEVSRMTVMQPLKGLNMGFCLHCHRTKFVNDQATLTLVTDCGTCHR